MANRFGTNSAMYDLSRLMTFAVGIPPQNIFSAPIILDNPAITSGIALFSHTPQPFTVAVAAASELSLFDLNFANTGAAGTQFYGLKIQSNSDVVDTGAGIALFNLGRADSIYIDVAGKAANPVGNTPTGVGIDVNKSPTSSAERASANSRQIGIQIFDWSTTNQGVGGPAGMLIQKQSNLNTDHFLTTWRANRNMQQMVVVSGDAGYNGGMPVWRLDDETTAQNWLSLVARGEFVFNKDGVGVQWVTPGAMSAYIIASTNDLKLKSGGTGIRFVNQADTQTIVMMQDDLSVDIPNNETRFQALKIVSDRIENTITNALGAVSISYNGFNGGTTQFRDFKIFDGKQQVVAIFEGSSRSLTVTNQITIGAATNTTANALIVNGQGTNAGAVPARYNAYLFDSTAFAAGVGSGLAMGGRFGAANTGFFGVISAKKVNGTDGDGTGVMDLTVSKSDNTQVLGLKLLSDGTIVDAYFPNKVGVGVTALAPVHVKGAATGEQLRLDDTSATGNPFISFFQSGTRRAFLQSNDTSDTVIIASEYGDVSIKAASSAGSDTDTEYVRVVAGGLVEVFADLVFVNAGTGLPYGSCWGNEINWTQAAAVQNTWYIISDADMADATGGLNLITHDGSGRLTVTFAGRYLVVYSVTMQISAANKHVQTGIAVNGSMINDGIQHYEVAGANAELTLGSTAVVSLAASGYVEIAVRTTDTGTPNIDVDHLNFSLVHVGG